MIIAQVCLRLDTIKGHCKMCSFTVLGGGVGGWGGTGILERNRPFVYIEKVFDL